MTSLRPFEVSLRFFVILNFRGFYRFCGISRRHGPNKGFPWIPLTLRSKDSVTDSRVGLDKLRLELKAQLITPRSSLPIFGYSTAVEDPQIYTYCSDSE